jgi:DNA invertase Pin-like site-specific DNA recombinase
MSGTMKHRPGLDAFDGRCTAKRVSGRGVFSIRPIRSLDQAAGPCVGKFRTLGIDFISHQKALDTSTSMGRAMFTIIAGHSELERSVIRDRVVAGLEHARQHGTKSSRAVGRPRLVFRRDQVKELRAQGMSWHMFACMLGVSVASARRA